METSCGDLTTVEIELNGVRVRGRYRVMGKTVVVYFDEKIKFVDYGMDSPERSPGSRGCGNSIRTERWSCARWQ
jgi:hypothetical protein